MVRSSLVLSSLVLSLVAAGVQGARGAEVSPDVGLAWRLDALSSDGLGPGKPDAAYRRSASLLDAAHRLAPSEPRFPRLRKLALLHVGDIDGAIAALKAYRDVSPATRNDRAAQSQLIDLYAARLETAEAKLKYLTGLLDVQDIPVEVRSHVAVECAELLAQQSPQEAADMAKRAVQLYPLPEATRQYYERVAKTQSLKEQVAALVAMLSANPNQPGYSAELARLLASAGLADASLEWYDLSLRAILPLPTRPPWFHDLLVDFAAQLMLTERTQVADALLGQMLDSDPTDADAWFLKLSLAQSASGQVTFEQTLDLGRSALARRWNGLRDRILSGAPATQPAAVPATPADSQPVEPLDPAPVIEKLKTGQFREAEIVFINAMFDLAWFELYFDKQPDLARKWIDAMRAIVPADDLKLQVLEGWHALASNQPGKAREIFSKIADRHALAGLGMIRADEAEKKQPDPVVVQKLLAGNRTGLAAAVLWEALKKDATRPATQPAADDVPAELERFPKGWREVIDPRTAKKVYTVRVEPVQSTIPFGEPMLANVRILNSSDHDLAIGPQGVLRPELWFDAQIMGLDQRSFPGVAYDQITDQIVLRPRASITEVVRLDEGDLRQALLQAPGTVTHLSGDVITNPLTIPQGVIPGSCGTANNFGRTFGYAGIQLGTPTGKKKLDAALASTSPAERLRTLDLLAAYARIAAGPEANDALKKAVADFPAAIDKARSDSSPAVAAWAGYLSVSIAPDEQKEKVVREMIAAGDWRVRLMGILAGSLIPPDVQQQVVAPLAENDADASVKSAAAATLDFLAHPTTQPTTAPASQPTTAPGA